MIQTGWFSFITDSPEIQVISIFPTFFLYGNIAIDDVLIMIYAGCCYDLPARCPRTVASFQNKHLNMEKDDNYSSDSESNISVITESSWNKLRNSSQSVKT